MAHYVLKKESRDLMYRNDKPNELLRSLSYNARSIDKTKRKRENEDDLPPPEKKRKVSLKEPASRESSVLQRPGLGRAVTAPVRGYNSLSHLMDEEDGVHETRPELVRSYSSKFGQVLQGKPFVILVVFYRTLFVLAPLFLSLSSLLLRSLLSHSCLFFLLLHLRILPFAVSSHIASATLTVFPFRSASITLYSFFHRGTTLLFLSFPLLIDFSEARRSDDRRHRLYRQCC